MRMLEFCNLQIKVQPVLTAILLVLFLFCNASCTKKSHKSDIRIAEHLLWQDLDSCLKKLEEIPLEELNTEQQKEWQLCNFHAQLRKTGQWESDSLLICLREHFKYAQDYTHAGEASYVLGTIRWMENDIDNAMLALKDAEFYLTNNDSCVSNLLGIVYYRLGKVAEEERMIDIASQYYEKSIPFLKESNNYLYLACAYADYACTMNSPTEESISLALDTAIMYVSMQDNPSFKANIKSMQLEKTGADIEQILPYYHCLCDTFQQYIFASNLIDYYMQQKDFTQVEYYLEVLALDTAYAAWSREHYQYQLAEYLNALGQKDSAIQVLQRLHLRQTHEIETHSYARSYTISQFYDVVSAQERTLQLQMEKQRLLLILMAALSLCVLLVCTWYVHQQRARRIMAEQGQKIAEQTKQMAILQAQNVEKQQALISQLHMRLQLTEQLLSSQSQQIDFEKLPDWAKTLMNTLLFTTDAQIKKLCQDIDNAYDKLLMHLKEQHPNLTNRDQIVCGLIVLGFNIGDICFLTRMSKETMYIRRKRIKQHLDLTAEDDLEQWLQNYQANHVQASQVKK